MGEGLFVWQVVPCLILVSICLKHEKVSIQFNFGAKHLQMRNMKLFLQAKWHNGDKTAVKSFKYAKSKGKVDDNVKRLFDYLEKENLMDNTIII
jgi:arylsulfatase A-like enzyme